MPFNWIFAIIVGVVILLIAIYGVSKIIIGGEELVYTESASKLISLLDPLETGLASGKASEISFEKETRTFYTCEERDNRPFGLQTLAFSEKTIGDKYGEMGQEIIIKDKYVFAEEVVEGRKLYVFSKPFFIGYKVADLTIISSKDYCFYQCPEDIKDEIENLNLNNIKFSDNLQNCSGEIVCFNSPSLNCKISVNGNYDSGKIIKDNKEMYYVNNLVFGAIFSSPEIYECNVKRLKNKFNELALIYQDKAKIIEKKGCSLNMYNNLNFIRSLNLSSSADLIMLSGEVKIIESMNKGAQAGCKLY